MPVWLWPILKLAISIGSPYLLNWIKEKFKNLPVEVIDIINELIKSILDPKVSTKEAKRHAKSKLKACVGVACPSETKSD